MIVELLVGFPAITFGVRFGISLSHESGESVVILPVHLLRDTFTVMPAERSVHSAELVSDNFD